MGSLSINLFSLFPKTDLTEALGDDDDDDDDEEDDDDDDEDDLIGEDVISARSLGRKGRKARKHLPNAHIL